MRIEEQTDGQIDGHFANAPKNDTELAIYHVNHKMQQKDTLWTGNLRVQRRGVDQEPE